MAKTAIKRLTNGHVLEDHPVTLPSKSLCNLTPAGQVQQWLPAQYGTR